MPPRISAKRSAKAASAKRQTRSSAPNMNAANINGNQPPPSSKKEKRKRSAAPAKVGDDMVKAAEEEKLKGDIKKASKESLRDELNKYSSELLYWWGMDYKGWKVAAVESNQRGKVIDALLKIKATAPKDNKEIIENYEKLVREKYTGEWRHTAVEEDENGADDTIQLDEEEEEEDEEDDDDVKEPSNKRAKTTSASSSSSISSSPCRFCSTPTSHGLCPYCGCSSHYDYNNEINVDLRRLHHSRLSMTGTEQKTIHTSAAVSGSSESEKKESALSGRDKEWKRQTDEGDSFPRFTAAPSAYSVKKAFEDLRKSYYGANYVQPSDSMIKLIQSGKLRAIGHAMPKSTKEELESDGRDNSEAKLSIDSKGLKVSEKFKVPPVNSLTSFLKIVTGAIVPSLVMQPQVVLDWVALTRSVILLSEQYGWESASFYLSSTLTNCVANRKSFGELDMDAFNSMQAVRMHGGNFQRPSVEGSAGTAAAAANRGVCRHFNSARGCNKNENCTYEHICSNRNCENPVGHNFINCSARKDSWNGESASSRLSSSSFPPSRGGGASSHSRSDSSANSRSGRSVSFKLAKDSDKQ